MQKIPSAHLPSKITAGSLLALSILLIAALIPSIAIVHASASKGTESLNSVHEHKIGITKGLDLKTIDEAISNEPLRDANDISHIAVFFNTGGSLEDGSLQPKLAYEMPLTVSKLNGRNGYNDDGEIRFQYFVDTTYDMTPDSFDCSDIRLHIILDHKEEIYVTRWLGYEGRQPTMLPSDTGIISIKHIQTGYHTISLLPEGRVEGCNTSDFLASFGGTIVLYGS